MRFNCAVAWRILGAGALALGLSSAAWADDLTGRLSVGGAIGPSFVIGNEGNTRDKTVGLGGGGGLAYGINRRWSARVGYDNYDPPSCAPAAAPAAAAPQSTGSDGETTGSSSVETVQVSGAYALAPDSAWNPNVHVGVGPAWAHNVSSLGNETYVGVSAGMGVDRFVTKNVTVGAAVDWLGVMAQGTGDSHSIRPGLTAGYWFGGKD